jgi:hypothetical protein
MLMLDVDIVALMNLVALIQSELEELNKKMDEMIRLKVWL